MIENLRPAPTQRDDISMAFDLLRGGVPLTLLLDLATPIHSSEIYEREAGQADWLVAGVA